MSNAVKEIQMLDRELTTAEFDMIPEFHRTKSIENLPRRIDADDEYEMSVLSGAFWLNEIHTCLTDGAREMLAAVTVLGVDTLRIDVNVDCGCSRETTTILEMPTHGQLGADTLLEAVWAAYILSLKATMDGGKNERAHLNDDETLVPRALEIVERLGAVSTPCDEVYGSDGTYLELLRFEYDPATRTLTANPSIGS
jgi:hypothetical protein